MLSYSILKGEKAQSGHDSHIHFMDEKKKKTDETNLYSHMLI